MTEGVDHPTPALLDPRRAGLALLGAAVLTVIGVVLLLGPPAGAQPAPGEGLGGPVTSPPQAAPTAPTTGPGPATAETRAVTPLGLAIGLIGGLAVGVTAGALTGRLTAPSAPTGRAAPVATDPTATHQREALVRAIIDTRDHLTSAALADRLGQALWSAGVGEVRADGEAFDPRRHQAVDQVATTDQRLDGTVASTERPGYVDGGAPLRLPQVVVHRYQP